MEKTIKEIADELKIDKQKVYRYIKKNHINEAHQKNSVMYYDDVAQHTVKQAFLSGEPHQDHINDVHQKHINEAVFDAVIKQNEALNIQIQALLKQLETKDKQIGELTRIVDQQQQLHMIEQKKLLYLEDKKGIWAKIFGIKNKPQE